MARSKVWKYYDKLDHNTAQCQLCERIIKTCGNTSNLMKHIKTHPQINVNNDDAQVVRGMFKRHSDDFKRRMRKIPQARDKYHHIKAEEGQKHEAGPEFDSKTEVDEVFKLDAGETVESVTYGWAVAVDSPSQSPTETVSAEDIIEFEPKHVNDLYELKQGEYLAQTEEEHISLGDDDQDLVTVYQTPPSPEPPTHPDNHSLVSQLAYFVCRDRHPVDVILGEGLKFLMQTSSSMGLQQWPTVDQLSAYIEHQTKLQVSRLRRKLTDISTLSLSCAIHDNNYMELVAYYHENRKRQSRLLSVQLLPEQYNVSHIVEHLETACHRFDIEKSVIACLVTQSNCLLEEAVHTFLGEHRHVPCFAHLMKTLMADIIMSPKIHDLLEKILAKRKRKMPLNLAYPLSAYNAIEQCIRLEESALSSAEMDLAQQLLKVIKPVASCLRELNKTCSDSDLLAAQILPMIYTLIQELKSSTRTDLKTVIDLRMFIVRQLEASFEDLERNEHLAFSTLLDPRFRNIPFQRGSLVANYMTHLYELKQGDLEQHDNIIIDSEEGSTADYDIWAAYKSHCQNKSKQNNPTEHDEGDEIASYFYEQLSNVQSDPVLLWKDIEKAHPFLNKLAKRYLHIPAAALSRKLLTGSETLGRYDLMGENVENILFMADVPFKDWV